MHTLLPCERFLKIYLKSVAHTAVSNLETLLLIVVHLKHTTAATHFKENALSRPLCNSSGATSHQQTKMKIPY